MPIILTIVAIMVMALSGAVYFRSTHEAVPATSTETDTTTESSSGIVNILDDAKDAADAIERGLGNQATDTGEKTPQPSPTSVTPPAPTTPVATTPASTYADGIYTKTATYRSPGGTQSVTVTFTLANDVITDSKFFAQSTNNTCQRYMDKFASGYSALVVGKDIDAVNLTVVNGSSLTPKGFMDAVAAIKGDATL